MNFYLRARPTALMLVASLLLAALAVPAQAGGGAKTRRVSGTYAVASFFPAFRCAEADGVGCVRVTPKAGERFIHVEVQDAAGMAVYAYVNQDANGDGRSDIDGPICGRTEFPLRIVPEVPVHVFVLASYSYCPGAVATRGTIEATLGGSYDAVRKAASE